MPGLGNLLSAEIFPNVQFKSSLAQRETISTCPVASYLGEETNSHLAKISSQGVVERDKVPPIPPFLQAE